MAGTEDRLGGEEGVPEAGHPSSFKDHLVNALGTSARYADEMARELKALHDEHPEGRSRTKFILTTLIRKAVTISTTHTQLAYLVRGEDLDTRDLRREREAEIYTRIKAVQTKDPSVRAALDAVLEYIREDSSVN